MPFARLTPFPFHKYLIPSFLMTALKELCGINEFCLCILHNSTGAEVVLEIIEAILERVHVRLGAKSVQSEAGGHRRQEVQACRPIPAAVHQEPQSIGDVP